MAVYSDIGGRLFNSADVIKGLGMSDDFRRKVVSEGEIIKEKIRKTYLSKNVYTEIIERKTYKALILECGHYIKLSDLNIRLKTTKCHDCWALYEKF